MAKETKKSKAKVPQKQNGGRQKAPIDWNKVDQLLMFGCSGAQVASTIGVHPETLYDRCVTDRGYTFTDYSYKFRQKGDAGIHVKQYQKAMSGNTQMLIHLGEQRLGQSRKIDQKIEMNASIVQKKILALPDNGRR